MKTCPLNPLHMCNRSSCVGPMCALQEHAARQKAQGAEWYDVKPFPPGCICPPTSEQTCMNPTCPRRGVSALTTSTQLLTEGKEGK